ncbi:MAG: efflux RND transporter permease subunit [Planctomycetales bacterium]|nr:efflux RND transporter permease subunit [Planctomycetales bacterium]
MNVSPESADQAKQPFLTHLVDVFLRGDVTLLFTIVSLLIGIVSLYVTPREEEPQIVVPMADIMVQAPGLNSMEVERSVTQPLEKLLYQIDGVEYVYSMSRDGQAVVTVRYYVGEDREDSLIKLYNKLQSSGDQIPPVVSQWVVKPIEIDDVPIVTATLWSDQPDLYGDHELRRLAEELQYKLQEIPSTNRVWVIGGRPRVIRVELDAQQLAARSTSPLQVARALQASNAQRRVGQFQQQNTEFLVEAGTFCQDATELGRLVVSVQSDRPVYLKDVATIIDGPAEVANYSWIAFGPAAEQQEPSSEYHPAVHIAVAKQKGSNAVRIAEDVHERLATFATSMLPDGVHYNITRDYGETANDKVNELVEGLVVAVLTVVGLIGVIIGWRAALVVAMAIPVCYSLTLFVNLLAGYTINRVTMFALILALGLLVDDPITDVENIARYFAMRVLPPRQAVLRAIQEVRPALILSTLAIIASFLPLTFITGMMGPYMGPMALNVPLTVSLSTVVAFVVTPWLAMVALRRMNDAHEGGEEYDVTKTILYRISNRLLRPVLLKTVYSYLALAAVGVLLLAAMMLPALRLVPLKMLPYDNKNEFQVMIDMPEGTTLERCNSVAQAVADELLGQSEVRDVELFVGQSSPMDFNGMVRHYFLRQQPHEADIRVNLVHKDHRVQQSHEIVLRLRQRMDELARQYGANIKLVEVPPGPPVIATLTAEIYGSPSTPYARMIDAARHVEARMRLEPGVVDVDLSTEADQVKYTFVTDKEKAALSGVSTQDVVDTLSVALSGMQATILHLPDEVNPLSVELRIPLINRSAIDDLSELYVQGQTGHTVQLGGLGRFVEQEVDKTIFHKNLRRVMYVYGEVAGRAPADAILDMELDREEPASGGGHVAVADPRPVAKRSWFAPGGGVPWSLPADCNVEWAGEGEWKITLDVFRDLGLAFAAALVAIFVILMFETGSRVLPVIIMLAIPLSMIGIMPGFWLLNAGEGMTIGGFSNPVFFTATAMIGMIALAGIVVRNSVVLIDFIQMAMDEGLDLQEAIVRSVAVRTRPIILTAGTTLLGNWVITLDPVFSGLAWAIIFGILTSTLFTLVVVPVVYWLLYRNQPPKLVEQVG